MTYREVPIALRTFVVKDSEPMCHTCEDEVMEAVLENNLENIKLSVAEFEKLLLDPDNENIKSLLNISLAKAARGLSLKPWEENLIEAGITTGRI
jgi:hypothetical protein